MRREWKPGRPYIGLDMAPPRPPPLARLAQGLDSEADPVSMMLQRLRYRRSGSG